MPGGQEVGRPPQDVKRLLEAFLDLIEVDSKQFAQPSYFFAGVRIVLPIQASEHLRL